MTQNRYHQIECLVCKQCHEWVKVTPIGLSLYYICPETDVQCKIVKDEKK